VTRGAFSTEPRRQSDCGRPDHWAAAAERKSRFLQAMIYRGDVATEVTKLEQQDGGNPRPRSSRRPPDQRQARADEVIE
jgi:hypothetical protein